jgi:tetrapyrrole methylase family protein/MazG family protein
MRAAKVKLGSEMKTKFEELVDVMARLRAPGGCPWDAEQTYESLGQYLLEECFEAFDAIQEATETNDTTNLREELGDVLLQVVFHATIAEERGDFTIDDVARGVTEKLILRHPHVFGEKDLKTADDVLNNWDELKKAERAASGKVEKMKDSILDEVPVAFPALIEANKITKKAAKAKFDWENAEQIFDKIAEESEELKSAISENRPENVEEEIGDLLFAVVNLARRLNVEPEAALKKTNRKFRKRFKFIEENLKARGKQLEQSNLEEMDALWNEAKLVVNG